MHSAVAITSSAFTTIKVRSPTGTPHVNHQDATGKSALDHDEERAQSKVLGPVIQGVLHPCFWSFHVGVDPRFVL